MPSVSLADVRKEELPENINRRILCSSALPSSKLWRLIPKLSCGYRPRLPKRSKDSTSFSACPDNRKLYRDLLIYPKDYHLTRLDKMFIEELYKAKISI
ncbi:MAG: hypothetical protein ACLUSP_05750 [Christensenellales bacterium]